MTQPPPDSAGQMPLPSGWKRGYLDAVEWRTLRGGLTEGAGRAIDILINNAGGGIHQRFADIPWERTAAQIQLNVGSPSVPFHGISWDGSGL